MILKKHREAFISSPTLSTSPFFFPNPFHFFLLRVIVAGMTKFNESSVVQYFVLILSNLAKTGNHARANSRRPADSYSP